MVFAAGLCLLLAAMRAPAQTVEVEHGERVAGLWCFPVFNRPGEWVYIPARGRLALDDEGRPRFSFIRYAFTQEGNRDGGTTITRARGGGLLHFLVLYDTPNEQVAEAQRELRERMEDDTIRLTGPLVFESGRYTLVSSIINPAGKSERHILATGTAPVLEGNQLALSFELEPEQAMLLMESFRMDTPDISIVFDLGFSGITDAYQARVFVDWSQIRKSHGFSAGGTVYFVSADVEAEIDRLIRDNAIRMESVGEHAAMEDLIARIYDRLLDLLFNPVAPERVPPDQRGGLSDALGALIGSDGLLSSGNTTGFGAHVGYQLKDLRSEGETVLDFNHRSRVGRHAYLTFNIGDLYRLYGDDRAYFRAVNPDDPTFDQREILLSVDGSLVPEFEEMVNSVTVTLRKQHADGSVTLEERVVNSDTLASGDALAPMIYGWRNDGDRLAWLDYEYRTHWSFRGGGQFQSDWIESSAAMVELYAPFLRQQIQLVNTGIDLAAHGVRAVIVSIEYPFFGIARREQLVIRGDRSAAEAAVEITLPRDRLEYDFRMTWVMADGTRPQLSGSDSSGLIFIDPPPG
jgi:hypothetical protein